MRTNIEFVILLLHIIRCNGNTNNLVWNGFSYTQIIESLDKLVSKDYVQLLESKYVLTSKGKEYLNALNKKRGRNGLYRYMSPELRYKTRKLKIEEIYVPLRYKRE